jgi:hypothetical protein
MKRITSLSLAVMMALPVGLAFAQNQQGGPKARPTQVSLGKGNIKNSHLHQVNLRIRDQKRQIAKDLKAGKLTKEQAKASFLKLKDARKKELEFTRQNRNKELTTEQRGHLDKMLDQNGGSR